MPGLLLFWKEPSRPANGPFGRSLVWDGIKDSDYPKNKFFQDVKKVGVTFLINIVLQLSTILFISMSFVQVPQTLQ